MVHCTPSLLSHPHSAHRVPQEVKLIGSVVELPSADGSHLRLLQASPALESFVQEEEEDHSGRGVVVVTLGDDVPRYQR
eukprot:scaffold635707_cov32-Prasinocladus_malaysianus.AAC.1